MLKDYAVSKENFRTSSFTLTDKDWNDLAELAHRHRVSKSAIVRALIRQEIEAKK